MSTAKERLLARATLKQTKENTIAVPNKNVLDQRQNAAAQARQKAYQSAYKTAQTVAQNRAAAQKTGAPVLGAKSGTFWYNDQNTPNFDPAKADTTGYNRFFRAVASGISGAAAEGVNALGNAQRSAVQARKNYSAVDVEEFEKENQRYTRQMENADSKEDRDYFATLIAKNNEAMAAAQQHVDHPSTFYKKTYSAADRLKAVSDAQMAKAQNGEGKVGGTLYGLTGGLTKLGVESAAGIPGLAVGSYGGQSMEARQAGESWKQQNIEGGISSAGTLAAGILSGAVGSRGVLEFLKGHGVSNTAAHAIQAMGSGAAWGGTDTAVTEAGKKLSRGDSYSFDGGAVASSAAVGAMFGILRYIGRVAGTSGQNRAYLQQEGKRLKQEYAAMKSALGTMTPEETARQADSIFTHAYDVEKRLDDMDIVGADAEISAVKDFLKSVRSEMSGYFNDGASRLGEAAPSASAVPVPASAAQNSATNEIIPESNTPAAAPSMGVPEFTPEDYANIGAEPGRDFAEDVEPQNTIPVNDNPAALVPVANTLGESGKKAMLAFYDGDVDTDFYMKDFVAAYNAGLHGKARPPENHIRESQAVAAYTAGQNDAKAKAAAPAGKEMTLDEAMKAEKKSPGRTPEQKAAALKGMFEQQKNIVRFQSPERQAYLSGKYQQYEPLLKALKAGDKLIDDSGDELATVDVTENGIIITGESGFFELIPNGTFSSDSVISVLEAGDGHFETADGTRITAADDKSKLMDALYDAVNPNGLTALSGQEQTNLSSGKKNRIVSSFNDAVAFIKNALSNRQNVDRAYLGKVPDATARKVLADTGIDIAGYNAILPSDAVRHMFNDHGDPDVEMKREQINLTPESAADIASVLSSPDKVSLSGKTDARGLPTLLFEKQIGDYYITAQAVADGTHSIQTDTLYIKKKNSQDTVFNTDVSISPEHNARSVPPQSPSMNNIAQGDGNSNGKTGENDFYVPRGMTAEEGTAPFKIDNGDRANQTSLAANGDAGTQSLLSKNNLAQSGEKNNDYLDALADDKNAPTIEKGNRPTMARKDLRTDVLNLFSVPAGSRKALGEAIDRAGAEMLRTGGVTEENRAKLMDALYDAGVTVRDADPAYKAVRDDLRGRKIYVDESTRADLGDDWRGMVGRALGNGFSLTTDAQKGTAVDQIMQEMAEKFGEGMFDETSDSSTALRQLLDIAEAGKPEHISLQQEAEDLGRQYGEGAVEDHADALRRQMDAALQRFAEKAGLEIKLKDRSDAAVAKERERWRKLLQRSNDRGRERLENQKTYYQDMMQRKKERHERSVAATQTQKSLRYLRRRLGYHDTKLAEALDSLSAEDRETAEYALQNIADNAKSLTAEANEKLKANAERYKALVENDKNYIPDKETLEMLERMDRDYLANKSVEELANIHRVVQTLRTHLADMDREIGKEHGRQMETIYQQSKAEIQGSKGRKPGSKARRKMTDFLDSQLTPMNRLKQLGGWKDGAFYSMAKQLEAGERARKEFEVKANLLLKDFREKNADWIAKSDGQGKDATWYELEVPALLEWGEGDKPIFGDTVKVSLTPAMRVELARGVRNYDNLRHAEGGVTFPDRTLYSRGERAEAYARGTTIRLAPETMKKLFSYENLTPEEQELYRLGDQFFNKMAKDAINKTSQEMDGVDRAMSQYYSKIYTNASYRPTDVTTVDQSLGGMGSLQKRVQSKAPMLAVSMWEAYADTIDTVGKYSGLAIPVRNMNMLYNWMESGQNESLKSVLEKKWGTDSTKFIGKLLTNLQNKQVLDKSGVDALADYLLKNYITATFGANPGIVLKQATSFPSGAAVLGWDTIPTPKQLRKIDTELIAKYTPELEYRSMGYATPELAELKNNPNWTQKNKFTRFVFGGAIQAMDRATVKYMWPWAENAVRKNYPDLKPGTDAFYRKTAEFFNKAVSETQPMYDVMHRAEIMQNPSALTRTFTMFKTVPLQQQNMIRKAVGEAQAAKTPEEISKTRRQIASTAAALVLATLSYEGVEFFNQLLKNAAKGYRDDDDDKLTVKSVLTTMAEKSVKDLAGDMIGGKDLADVLMKSFGDVDYYQTETPGLSQMMDVKTAAEQMMETFKTVRSDTKALKENGGSLKQYVKENGNDLLGDVKDLATLLAELGKGVPVPNLEKYLLGTLQWTSPELKEEYEALWDSTNKRDLTGLSGGALRVRVGDLMDLRVDHLSDEAKDELARLYESVGTEVIPSDVPSTIHMDDEDASLTRTMQQTYQNAYGGVLKDNLEMLLTSKPYQSMTDQAKSAAVTDLYDYAKAVAANKTVGKEMTGGAQKAAGVLADGGELPDFLHFCATVGEKNAAERLEYLSRGKYSEASKAAIYLNALASDSKQEAWAELKQQGITKEEFYRYALAVNGQTAKADVLRAMDGLSLSDDKKATLYFAAEASDSEKEKLAAAEKEGVSEQAYFQYLTASAGMSKKAEKLVAINGLDLTVKQKNALYDANGWAKSTLYDAPWYDIMPRLSSGGEGSRRTSGQSSGTSSGKTGTALDKYGLGKYSLDKYDIMPKL